MATLTRCRVLAADFTEESNCFLGDDLAAFLNEMAGVIDDEGIAAAPNP